MVGGSCHWLGRPLLVKGWVITAVHAAFFFSALVFDPWLSSYLSPTSGNWHGAERACSGCCLPAIGCLLCRVRPPVPCCTHHALLQTFVQHNHVRILDNEFISFAGNCESPAVMVRLQHQASSAGQRAPPNKPQHFHNAAAAATSFLVLLRCACPLNSPRALQRGTERQHSAHFFILMRRSR